MITICSESVDESFCARFKCFQFVNGMSGFLTKGR